jgi:hypothetical protein
MEGRKSRSFPGALALSRRVLRVLVVANFVYGFLVLALLVASLVAEAPVMVALGVELVEGSDGLMRGMRFIALAGVVSIPIAHVVLTRLLAIVDTVRAGDPFVVANAGRLHTIAWSVLGLELINLLIGAVAAGSASSAQPLDVDWSFSVTPWIAVLLLSVLARVFDQGARMRADIEGTV